MRAGAVVACLLAGVIAITVVAVSAGSPAQTTPEPGPTLETGGPAANLTASPIPVHPGEVATLDATASTAGGDASIVECAFDTDGDGDVDRSGTTCRIDRTYEVAGTYDVSVRVATTDERTATASETVVVQANRTPQPTIAVDPVSPTAGRDVTLSAVDSSDPDGDVVSHTWTVDGRTLTGETATVEFGEPGAYDVTLSIADDDGAEAQIAGTVTVSANRAPTATLAVDPPEVRAGGAVTVDASASADPDGSIVAYRWDFDGDGTVDRTTDEPATELVVDDAGERSIRVTVVDDGAATAEASASLVVTRPGANATATPDGAGSGDGGNSTGNDSNSAGDDLRDPGIVPVVPDWLALAGVVGLVALGGIHRKQPIPERLREWREQRSEGEIRRDAAKKGVGFAAKTLFKRLFRLLADAIEGSGDAVGALLEWVGAAIRRVADRIASVLRRIG